MRLMITTTKAGCGLAFWLLLPTTAVADAGDDCPSCTQVIGFSQTAQWFRADDAFLAEVESDGWQLLWNSGAGVDRWQNPDYTGWNNSLFSPCSEDFGAPQRIVLTISGPYGANESAWAEAIENTIDTILDKIPSARQILLQPVVGGPCPDGCPDPNEPDSGGRVRASWQHYHIANAIGAVVETYETPGVELLPGFFPTVRGCEDYGDGLGHLTPAGAVAAGQTIGQYYAQLDSAALHGDFNRDGVVDAADYVVWRKQHGTPAEYDKWQVHFGQSSPVSGVGNAVLVSEPSGLCLLSLILLSVRRVGRLPLNGPRATCREFFKHTRRRSGCV